MIALWVALVALTLVVGYGWFRIRAIEARADEVHGDIGGLAGDIVSLGFLVGMVVNGPAGPDVNEEENA